MIFYPQQHGSALRTQPASRQIPGTDPAPQAPSLRPHPAARPPQTPPHPAGPAPQEQQYLLVQPQVLLAGAESLHGLRLSEGTQGATHLLLHLRVLVGDSVQQNGEQPCRDKAQWRGQARPRPHRRCAQPLRTRPRSWRRPPHRPGRSAASTALAGISGTHWPPALRSLWPPVPRPSSPGRVCSTSPAPLDPSSYKRQAVQAQGPFGSCPRRPSGPHCALCLPGGTPVPPAALADSSPWQFPTLRSRPPPHGQDPHPQCPESSVCLPAVRRPSPRGWNLWGRNTIPSLCPALGHALSKQPALAAGRVASQSGCWPWGFCRKGRRHRDPPTRSTKPSVPGKRRPPHQTEPVAKSGPLRQHLQRQELCFLFFFLMKT